MRLCQQSLHTTHLADDELLRAAVYTAAAQLHQPDIVSTSSTVCCMSLSFCCQLITHLTFQSTQLCNHGCYPCGSCQSSPMCFFLAKPARGKERQDGPLVTKTPKYLQ